MANDTGSIGGVGGINGTKGSDVSLVKKNEQMGKTEFLQLLVAQLKNQDPENAMDPQQFASQLAQFTQVEQLISINGKLDQSSSNFSSAASFLGHEVLLSSTEVSVEDGSAGKLRFDLKESAADVQVSFLSKEGEVVGTKGLGPMAAGKNSVDLTGIPLMQGTYGIKVEAVPTRGGAPFKPEVSVTGTVSGVIPGPEPTLIVNGQEIPITQVKQILAADKKSAT